MQHKNKILLLSPQPFFEARGTPINVREILYALSEKGFEVTLLCYPFGENIHINSINIERSYKIPFINSIKIGPSIPKLLLDITFFIKAIKLCIKNKYTIIHGIEEAGLIAGFISLFTKKPYIVDVDSSMSKQLIESGFVKSKLIIKLFELIESFFFKRATKVITVCEALTNDVLTLAPKSKVCQIEDFPLEAANENKNNINIRDKFKIPIDHKIILYAGNFEPYQGIDLLLSSFHLALNNKSFNSSLVLVGGSKNLISHYSDIANTLNISKHVHFYGTADANDMGIIHEQADILVSPRLKGSNTPLKIYSYMNSERLIIATNIYSHTQVLNDSCAVMVNTNSNDFCDGLTKACTKSEEENNKIKIKNAKELINTKYNRKLFREKIINVYIDIIESRNS